MDYQNRLRKSLHGVHRVNNWEEPGFSWDKARVAAAFSMIAYLHIPEYELASVKRANLIPCAQYREAIMYRKQLNVRSFLGDLDFGETYTLESPFVVSVITRVGNTVFISLRGTQYLYDWFVNFNARKVKPFPNCLQRECGSFHQGFYGAIAPSVREIDMEIRDKFAEDCQVYITGHSLGGALAAILNILGRGEQYCECPFTRRRQRGFRNRIVSCYTFGMPRYGDVHSITRYSTPYHIFNKEDIVPTVPPRFFGYCDCPDERCLTGCGTTQRGETKGNSFLGFIAKLASGKGIRNHDIELYVERVREIE